MDDAGALVAVESIKQLKARYCRYLDAKDWTAWRTLFAPDLVAELGDRVLNGADEFIAYTRSTLGRPSQTTVHHVHAPEITLTSPTTARGVWSLNDVVRLLPAVTLHGYGHYHETYRKDDDGWRLATWRLTRLREDLVTPLLTLHGATRLRAAAVTLARKRRP
ncbi:nuclear transport factor 2 family protein [Mycobacterium sp. 852002-51961_SCH5331710]|uniref:nuclear transport factor 2 family protein n=1 Tax=Mycobacterium sp. 852002-51961_SCH5331710 TaxID=1834105 RepID=UPI0007FF6A7D|nr:nuclear transport factor 2 family protein [Mycobacterium sp. 852002-51961_SCH5331710]OBB39906.1 DUF4440 domain-containing protein [Mycobacterium sp. 852002-51961_SCH5331710]